MIRNGSRALAVWVWILALGLGNTQVSAADFLEEFKTLADMKKQWGIATWGVENRIHSAANVTVENGILNLKLSGSKPGERPVCAGIVSKKTDFKYGTYRASMKMTDKPGAVVGFFTYLDSPLNEVDIEFLTRDPKTAHFTLHHVETNVDHITKTVAFDPSAAFHEYRFDWYADKVDYYIDSTLVATLKKNVPNLNCQLLFNHWSGNIANWGGAAPTEDVYLNVDWAWHSSEYKAPIFTPTAVLAPAHGKLGAPSAGSRFLPRDNRIVFMRNNRDFTLTGRMDALPASETFLRGD